MNYQNFLDSKKVTSIQNGFEAKNINKKLFDFQSAIVSWACKKGRAAIFADTGLGKGWMALEWANQVQKYTKGIVIIFAPLSVAKQFEGEADKIGIKLDCVKEMPTKPGIYSINYDRMECIDFDKISGIVLDESSVLKNFTSKTCQFFIAKCQNIPFRLSCTATPSPNDFMELANQAEFLGIMSRTEMLSTFFIHDGEETQKWRLKGHGRFKFWEWLATWAVVIQRPEDLGFTATGYDLPKLNFIMHKVNSGIVLDGELFAKEAQSLSERIRARRQTANARVEKAAEIVNNSLFREWIIWCNLNDESDAASDEIVGSVQVKGSDDVEKKEKHIYEFAQGDIPKLVTKASICGFGLNFQHCHNMVFVGLNDSWEEFYQAIRRCYRFGQKNEVNVHMIVSDLEGAILKNIERKEQQANEMRREMISHMKKFMDQEIKQTKRESDFYMEDIESKDNYTAYLGDCVEVAKKLESESVGFSVFSPPFASLYTYSNSERDMGNSKTTEQFWSHYSFLIKEQFRVMQSGRNIAIHCMLLPASLQHDGFIGLKDFRGDIIRAYEREGFIFHSEVCIWKDPVTAMQRTKALGLLHKTIRTDSARSRTGIPDYVVVMRKPGENKNPIDHTHDEFPVSLWQKYASPIWMDINPSDTLNFREARENDDERHICPLQLEVIERCIFLWSKKGDLVWSPFMGIGSEGYMAIKMGRRFVGSELKASYFKIALENLESARTSCDDLFTLSDLR